MFSNSRSEKLASRGLIWTKVYIISLIGGIPILAYFGIIKLEAIKLNEVGDFLAGAFGPLALIWVVLGFFQQGEELRNSVEALKLQAEELRNSVEQQKELVEVSQRTLNLQRKLAEEQQLENIRHKKPTVRPTFILSSQTRVIGGPRTQPAKYRITAKVIGTAIAYNLQIEALLGSNKQPIISLTKSELSEKDGQATETTPDTIPYIQENVILNITFRDIDGRVYSESYEYEFDGIETRFNEPKLLSHS
ncbi:MAG: hypothetical protein HWD91_03135 [Marivivens sp.]|uniref:hypothetical protein n=1 Tax=Marivivens sp. TaxID=1978374 RepID=UPI0017A7AC87|nr:hypothetical protein [Marivivens sp.]NVJ94560.1 hypothetical protein [Marivivens sp.]